MMSQCRHSIETFLEKIKKYEQSLRCGGSSSVMRDTAVKMKWQAARSNELTECRGEFHARNSAVTALLGTAVFSVHMLSIGRGHRLDPDQHSDEASWQ